MRTDADVAEGYAELRGKCKELSEALCAADPSLRLVRGHIFVPHWPSESLQPHWWCERPDGTVVDPSWRQFPFDREPGRALYAEFDGQVSCDECGKEGSELDFICESRYCFCSGRCYGRFVGVDVG
jgi:hypothetical protein